MKKSFYLVACIAFLCLLTSTSFAQETGIVRGTIIDQTTSEPIMFATIALFDSDTTLITGTETDFDGKYTLDDVPAGIYFLEARYLGYATVTITEVTVSKKEVNILDFTMAEESEVLEEVVVTAERVRNTEVALLVTRKSALTIDDGLSEQALKRYGSSDVSDATKRIPGASVTDGKYIVFRGLSDRYVNAQLNGQPLPSTDPYRNIPQLDLIPTRYLDNIIASKSFIPSQPGTSTGGSLDIKTKSFPDRMTLSASISVSYNTLASLNDNFLTHQGGDRDWLGFDDGTRTFPEVFQSQENLDNLEATQYLFAARDEEIANLSDEAYKSLNPQKQGTPMTSPLNHGVSLSFGNRYSVGEDEIGILAGFGYRRDYNFYENGVDAYWQINADMLDNQRLLDDTRSVENPSMNGFLSLAYKFGQKKNKISFNTLYNHDAQKITRYLTGLFPSILTSIYEGRALQFIERDVRSYQLVGEHTFNDDGLKFEWAGSFVKSYQDEPDFRTFDNSLIISENSSGEIDTTCFVTASELGRPTHFFRRVDDEQLSGRMDLTIPILKGMGKGNKIQLGGMYTSKDRNFDDDVVQIYDSSPHEEGYGCDPVGWFAPSNGGIVGFDSIRNRYQIGLFAVPDNITATLNSYTGTEAVGAAYAMGVFELNKLKIVAGARVERTDIEVISRDTAQDIGSIERTDVLPSLNLIYELTDRMNLRASVSQTLARPNMRELAPFTAFDFGGGFRYSGNPNLEQTTIQNFDLRWDFYPRPGELFAVSTYYKRFNNPIVNLFLIQADNEIQFANVDQANVYGVEFEFRKRLDFISDKLSNFNLITNLSLIESVVDITDEELEVIERLNPDKGDTRPFQGQSPFLFNAALNYANPNNGWEAIVALNIFGDRLSEVSQGFNPDVYEQSRAQLDISVSKSISKNWSARFSAQNLLDPEYRKFMEFNDITYTIASFRRGRTFALSLTYSLN
ncbi:MAG: TonB-dependent receptor [Bacteroidota bacterium]